MKVIKYKKMANSRYKVYLEDNHELLLYEDVILKFELLLKKDIDDDKLYNLIKSLLINKEPINNITTHKTEKLIILN